MSGYETPSEAVYKTLIADELLLDLLEFVEPIEDEDPDYRILNGWPEGGEIPLTDDQPAYLIITNEGGSSIAVYGRSELFQVRIVSLHRDLCEDLKDRVIDIIQEQFSFVDETKFTRASGRIQLGGGGPADGPLLYDGAGDFWAVNVRFTMETVKKG